MANKDFNVEIGKSNKEFYPLDKDLVTDTQRGVPKGTPRETLKKLGKYSKNVIVSAGKLTAKCFAESARALSVRSCESFKAFP